MGGELKGGDIGDGVAPQLLIHAAKDPRGTALQRVQVVKVWYE